jgi:hypothetical protein
MFRAELLVLRQSIGLSGKPSEENAFERVGICDASAHAHEGRSSVDILEGWFEGVAVQPLKLV